MDTKTILQNMIAKNETDINNLETQIEELETDIHELWLFGEIKGSLSEEGNKELVDMGIKYNKLTANKKNVENANMQLNAFEANNKDYSGLDKEWDKFINTYRV